MKPQLKVNSPQARDIAYALHPYTNARLHEEHGPVIIERAEGIRVYDTEGREYIEALAALWSVGVGYGEERLVQVAVEQMRKLPYYHTFSGKAHQPSIDLAEMLVAMTPERLSRAFFANSGSEANDSIIKMVWYHNNAVGRPKKKKFVARIRGYHGITIASGSLTGLPWNHRDFDLPIAGILHTACPHHYRFAYPGESEEEFASRLAGQFEQLVLAEDPDTIAAFIGEPVMGAGGVLVPPRTYWEKMQAVCRKYDILVIADEVITGFGRTGAPFASELYGIDPDFMTLSKQITSSYMPLSAVLLSDEIYQGIADNSAKVGTFGHGFTGSGHPVATAVAVENLKIFEERKLFDHAAKVGAHFQDKLRETFTEHPLIGEVRGVGLIAALEMVADKKTKRPFDPLGKVGAYFFERGHHHGVLIRNVQDSVAICPPLIVTESDIDEIVRRLKLTLDDTLAFARQNFGS